MKNSGVRRPKQRPPSDSTITPARGLLLVTSMALTQYCTHQHTLRHLCTTSRHTIQHGAVEAQGKPSMGLIGMPESQR